MPASLPVSGYGTDPNLITPSTPWPCVLSALERRLAAALSDVILPGMDGFPDPSEIAIEEFFDEWLSAPYPDHVEDRKLILSGLRLMDSTAQMTFGTGFMDLTTDQKKSIVTRFASSPPGALESSFFRRFRYLVVGGYFTSDVGLKAIRYVGNVPLDEFPGVSEEVEAIIDNELKTLDL